MTLFSNSKLTMLMLALSAFTFSACDDDDVLGVDVTDNDTLFMSTNNGGVIGVLDLNDENDVRINTFPSDGTDADGIYYNDNNGALFQLNRTGNTIVAYDDVLDDMNDAEGVDINTRSSSDFTNARGLANIADSQFIVAQDGNDDNNNENKLISYAYSPANGFSRLKTMDVDFNLWGIQYAAGKLYAIVDNTDSVAVFDNINAFNDGDTATPDRFIKIDGLVRTHGIQYNVEEDLMILTDIGDADSGDDGALFIIKDFSTFTGDIATAANYVKISGANTLLGNPVDVDYSEDEERIYVAERKRDGGLLLVFEEDATGNATPVQMIPFAGISSLYLNNGN